MYNLSLLIIYDEIVCVLKNKIIFFVEKFAFNTITPKQCEVKIMDRLSQMGPVV